MEVWVCSDRLAEKKEARRVVLDPLHGPPVDTLRKHSAPRLLHAPHDGDA